MKPEEIRYLIQDFLNYYSYDTGWVACSDWTDQQLGDSVGGNVTHNLNAPLSHLLVKILISTDGTDDNSFEIVTATRVLDIGSSINTHGGLTIFQVDSNNLLVQTGNIGIRYVNTGGGTLNQLDTESWYYKIKIWKLGW